VLEKPGLEIIQYYTKEKEETGGGWIAFFLRGEPFPS